MGNVAENDVLQALSRQVVASAQKTLDQIPVKNLAAYNVVFSGDKITLPVGMTAEQAIETLLAFAYAQEKVVDFAETFKVFPWDGAHALSEVLKKRFGWTEAKDRPGLFGDTPPQFLQMEVAPGQYKSIAWGDFGLPGIPATLQTHARQDEGRWVFQIVGKAKRKVEPLVNEILREVREYLARGGSIYQGKAIKLNLPPPDKAQMPSPSFMDTAQIDVSAMLFPRVVEDSINVNVFTPITRIEDLAASGIPFKRGILFAGTYGTGKTMAAGAAAKIAVKAGVTFLYIKEASQLSAAIDFAKMYANPGAVIFCEDIDQETDGERDVEMNDLLNMIDGIDTKHGQIMVVLTTNNVDAIHPAMLREGRLDAVIEFTAPDAVTAEKILRRYCGDTLYAGADLTEVGRLCAGQIPATLAEVVKRAKLAQLSLQRPGESVYDLTPEALRLSAESMLGQISLRERRIKEEKEKDKVPGIDDLIQAATKRGAAEAVAEQ